MAEYLASVAAALQVLARIRTTIEGTRRDVWAAEAFLSEIEVTINDFELRLELIEGAAIRGNQKIHQLALTQIVKNLGELIAIQEKLKSRLSEYGIWSALCCGVTAEVLVKLARDEMTPIREFLTNLLPPQPIAVDNQQLPQGPQGLPLVNQDELQQQPAQPVIPRPLPEPAQPHPPQPLTPTIVWRGYSPETTLSVYFIRLAEPIGFGGRAVWKEVAGTSIQYYLEETHDHEVIYSKSRFWILIFGCKTVFVLRLQRFFSDFKRYSNSNFILLTVLFLITGRQIQTCIHLSRLGEKQTYIPDSF
jgi:hypothetical protein